jgi:hypothetical protein
MIDAMIEIADPKIQHSRIIAESITFWPPCTKESSSLLVSFFLDIVLMVVYLKDSKP